MHLTGKTILITGGTSGIGFELARQLLALGNTVIITGRDAGRLAQAKAWLGKVETVQSDVSDPADIARLYGTVVRDFPALSVLINNAGIMHKLNLRDGAADLDALIEEILTNLSGPIRMTKQFLPHLQSKTDAAIINVSSGLAFVPMAIAPVYSATKAALHSFTQSLRLQLQSTSVKVFELAPPGTDTPLFTGGFSAADIDGIKPMDLTKMVRIALKGLAADTPEIRPGLSNVLMFMGRLAPNFMARQLGKGIDAKLGNTKS